MPQTFDSREPRVGRAIPRVLLGTVCVLVLGFYAWSARPGVPQMYGINNPADAYYNQLVQGFRSGQLNLKKQVPPGLTKLADPYDLAANTSYREEGRLHDVSYYQGKLYLYFGVTPALVLFWPYMALTGHGLFHKEAVAIFCSVGFLASVALLCTLHRRYFPEVGGWVVAAGALALGLATCVPAMLQRPDVYEVPISCAYAMVMLALAGVWRALHDPARRCGWLAAASLAYGLAVGARPNVLFGAVILLVPVVHAWSVGSKQDERRWSAVARMLAAATGPISFVGFGLMLYNYLRFDNPLEFGQHYLLGGNTAYELQHMFSPKYILFNLQVYFLQPIHFSRYFPYTDGIDVPPAPAGQLGVYNAFGVLPSSPFVWMVAAVPRVWQKRTADEGLSLRLFMAAMLMFSGISVLTVCFFAGACVRYQVDFMPVLVMLAVCGVFGLERALAAKPRWRSVARCGWIALLIFSVAVNVVRSRIFYQIEKDIAGVIAIV